MSSLAKVKNFHLPRRCAIVTMSGMENVNFQRIAQELVDEYGTNQLVAKRIGVPTSTVWRVVTGRIAKPSWVLGEKLIQAHEQMKRERAA